MVKQLEEQYLAVAGKSFHYWEDDERNYSSFSQMLFLHALWNFKTTYRHLNFMANKVKAMNHHQKKTKKKKKLNGFWQFPRCIGIVSTSWLKTCANKPAGVKEPLAPIHGGDWMQAAPWGSAWGPVSKRLTVGGTHILRKVLLIITAFVGQWAHAITQD